MSDSPVASPGLTSASSSRVMRVTSLLDGLRARRPLAFLDESHFRLTNVTRQLLHGWPPGNQVIIHTKRALKCNCFTFFGKTLLDCQLTNSFKYIA